MFVRLHSRRNACMHVCNHACVHQGGSMRIDFFKGTLSVSRDDNGKSNRASEAGAIKMEIDRGKIADMHACVCVHRYYYYKICESSSS